MENRRIKTFRCNTSLMYYYFFFTQPERWTSNSSLKDIHPTIHLSHLTSYFKLIYSISKKIFGRKSVLCYVTTNSDTVVTDLQSSYHQEWAIRWISTNGRVGGRVETFDEDFLSVDNERRYDTVIPPSEKDRNVVDCVESTREVKSRRRLNKDE